jgi:transposase
MPSIPQVLTTQQPVPPRPTIVLGVDTHRDEHVVAALTEIGQLVAESRFPATAAGYRRLWDWASSLGLVSRAGVECTGSYGKTLARHLARQGVEVIEVNHPDKAARRRQGKSDELDAQAAARAVLSGRAQALAKSSDGSAEMIRLLRLARNSAVKSRTQAINQLKAVLVVADPAVREALAGLPRKSLIRRCAELRGVDAGESLDLFGTASYALRLLARRVQQLQAEIKDLEKRITALVSRHAPQLLELVGVGPDSAAALLIAAGDNPHRLRSESSFAALCGVSPVEASSGSTNRRRLNRGGDRQANAALYRVAITRLRCDSATSEYVQRRQREGKSRREALRCLKRYIAREVYQLINPPPETAKA